MSGESKQLEAVYYPHAVPQSRASLTVLALVYDRVHFPGVRLPETGFSERDLASTMKHIAEQEEPIVQVEPGWRYLNQYLQLLPEREHLAEFCVFPDSSQDSLRFSLESSEFYGGFRIALERQTGIKLPVVPGMVGFELPNGAMIEMAGWGTYSANAMLYSVENDLPLVSVDGSIPFLGSGGIPEESRARIIATSLALQSVGMILPRLRSLTLAEISAFRRDSRDVIRPFRDSMLQMATDVEGLIRDRQDPDEIRRAARYIAETKVIPQLNELKRFADQPGKPWSRRLADIAKETPTFAAAVMVLPSPVAAWLLAARLVGEAADVLADKMNRDKHVDSHGAGYLLQITEDLR
jgi:hypothetical protein